MSRGYQSIMFAERAAGKQHKVRGDEVIWSRRNDETGGPYFVAIKKLRRKWLIWLKKTGTAITWEQKITIYEWNDKKVQIRQFCGSFTVAATTTVILSLCDCY